MDSKGLKERITSGLIVWLLVTIFIQPILSFTWKAILVVGDFVHQGYVDRIYSNAAVVDNSPYGRLTLLLLLLAPLLFFLFWVVRQLEADPTTVYFPRTIWFIKGISWGMVATIIVVVFVRVAILAGTTEITASFTQRLTVLAPAVSDTEFKTLKARWAGMKGKADYDALVAAMEKRAAELGVTLPPVRKP